MYVPFSTVTYVKPLSVLSLLLAAAPGFASAFASVLVPLAAFALVPSVLPFALLEALEAPGAVFSPAVPLVPEPVDDGPAPELDQQAMQDYINAIRSISWWRAKYGPILDAAKLADR